MIARTISIPYKIGNEFKILPFSDLHYDGRKKNSLCDVAKLKSDLKKKVDSRTIILGLGDWFGGILVKDAKRYRKAADAAVGEAILDEAVDGLAEIFYPYRKNIIGLGDGNHEDTILLYSGTSLIPRLIKELNPDIIHLGYSWLLKIMFSDNGGRVQSLIIRGHHGWGGGSRTEGADITKYSHDVKFWQANLFLYGHVHKLKVNPMEEGIMVGNNSWKTIKKNMIVCGTYQKTYGKTVTATYAKKAGYPPTSISTSTFYVKPTSHNGLETRMEI